MAYEFRTRRRVEFSDTDMEGIMHYSNFFRFMETAEHGFMRSLGHSVVLSRSGLSECLPRVHASCDYLAPLHFEDEVEIHLLVEKKGRRSITYQIRFNRIGSEKLEEVARGTLIVACARKLENGTLASVPLPEEIARKIQSAPADLIGSRVRRDSPEPVS